MSHDEKLVKSLYRRLLLLYPREFQERLGESMEQTFNDLCTKERRTKQEFFGFVLWTFIETATGICKEYLLLFSPGDIMQTALKSLRSSVLISFLLIVPFMVMEVINRRNFNEDFPFMLFFVLWLNLFAIGLILLPIVRGKWTGSQGMANPVPTRVNTLLTNPRRAAIISIALILSPGIFPLLESVGWLSVDRLFNGPDPEVTYLPGLLFSLGLILFPVAGGIIAGRPIVNTLRDGGSLFAHPINLMIVIVILFFFAAGVVGMIVDQWPCFLGVPNCD